MALFGRCLAGARVSAGVALPCSCHLGRRDREIARNVAIPAASGVRAAMAGGGRHRRPERRHCPTLGRNMPGASLVPGPPVQTPGFTPSHEIAFRAPGHSFAVMNFTGPLMH